MSDPFAFLDAPKPKSDIVDDTQSVRFTSWARADRTKRQIIEAIEGIEDRKVLEDYMIAESLMIDAIHMFDGQMSDDIEEKYQDHKEMLRLAEEWERKRQAGKTAINTPSNTKGKRMANPDFKKFVFKDVEFSWPRLDQPYRYNPQDKKSEPCAASAQGAGYSLAWTMPYEAAKALNAEMKAHYDDCRSRNTKLPEFSSVFGLKRVTDENGNETDVAQFTAKKSAMSNDGKENKMPTVVGVDHKPLEDRAIWGGSTGHVRVLAFPATNPQDASGGVSLLLDAVVVTKAEYGGDGLGDDFGDPEVVDDLPETTGGASATANGTAASEGATANGF